MLSRYSPRFQGCSVDAGRLFLRIMFAATVLSSRVLAGAGECPREYALETWLTDDGLSHNVVNRIRQDARGYLWLATASGLTRYDGLEFETYPMPADVTEAGYNIRDLAVVNGSTLLVLPPQGGVLQFEHGAFRPHPVSALLEGRRLAELYAEPGGAIWVGTYEGMLVRWENGKAETFGVSEGIGRRGLGFFFAQDGTKRTWIAAGGFLGYYDAGKLVRFKEQLGGMLQVASAANGIWIMADGHLWKMENDRARMIRADPPWLARKTSVRCLFEDRAGILWIGTARQGLYRYHCGELEPVEFCHGAIQAIAQDHEGNIWVGTDGGGIGRLRPKAFSVFSTQNGVPEALSTSVCQDERGDIWFANRAGGLVRKHDEILDVFPFTDPKNKNRSPLFVSSVCADGTGHLWVGATTGVYRVSLDAPGVLKPVNLPTRNPRVLFCSRTKDVWVSNSGGLLGYFREGVFNEMTQEHGFLGEGINAIAEDDSGTIWCGGINGALYRWNAGVLTRLHEKDGLPRSPIHALHADRSGALWIGTLNGLFRKTPEGMRHFTRADGLLDGMILQIQEDDHERLWFGGASGFFHIKKSEFAALEAGRINKVHAVSHGKEEGLSGLSPTTDYQPSTWKDRDGLLWFTTYKGVLALKPQAVVPNSVPPPVIIKEVLLDDLPLDVRKNIRIRPGRHHLQFSFAALSYAAPSKVRLRHRLEGVDSNWVDSTSARSARYSNLPAGGYRMQVIACNSDGIWNEEGATLRFTVMPAWWQTTWSRSGGVFLFTGLVVWGARSWTQRKLTRRLERLEQEHTLEKERVRIARDLHDELGASITGIGMLVDRLKESSSSAEIQPVIEQLAGRTQRFASDLERVVWTVSPKNNSLDRLAAFVGRFAQNFFRGTSILCLVRGQNDIPPLCLAPDVQHHVLAVAKEAINNVLKHSRASEVVIETKVADRSFFLSIRDNGSGFTPQAEEHSERNGLNNMRSRIAEIDGEIVIDSVPGRGTAISLRVPIDFRQRRTP
jgi:signal transduction histidine kinase/ligand-binding sensor domain-containing protein